MDALGCVVVDGHPVTSFRYALQEEARPEPATRLQAIHAEDGRFVVADVPAGQWKLTIVGPGFVAKLVENIATDGVHATNLGDIAVDPGRELRGHVTDERGAPVGGATVTVLRRPPFMFEDSLTLAPHGTVRTTTDAAGAYVVSTVPFPLDARVRPHGTCNDGFELETADDHHDPVDDAACNHATLEAVAPGTYQFCTDHARCRSITVAPSPAEQTVEAP